MLVASVSFRAISGAVRDADGSVDMDMKSALDQDKNCNRRYTTVSPTRASYSLDAK